MTAGIVNGRLFGSARLMTPQFRQIGFRGADRPPREQARVAQTLVRTP
jgi:hypothetical protein